MQADKLPPLPEWCLDDERAAYVLAGMSGPQYRNDMQDYARAALSAHGQPVVDDLMIRRFVDAVNPMLHSLPPPSVIRAALTAALTGADHE